MRFDYTVVKKDTGVDRSKIAYPNIVFLQETLNEFDRVPDRGPVITGEQSGEIWIVNSGAVIWENGEFFCVVRFSKGFNPR